MSNKEFPVIAGVITVRPDMTVAEGLSILDERKIRFAPVVDETGVMVGMFSLKQILMNLLPVSVTMEDGIENIDFIIGAAPGIAKRLVKLKASLVRDMMDRKPYVVHEGTPTWEAIRLLVRHGSPLPVVERETGKFIGIISEQQAISELSHAAP